MFSILYAELSGYSSFTFKPKWIERLFTAAVRHSLHFVINVYCRFVAAAARVVGSVSGHKFVIVSSQKKSMLKISRNSYALFSKMRKESLLSRRQRFIFVSENPLMEHCFEIHGHFRQALHR